MAGVGAVGRIGRMGGAINLVGGWMNSPGYAVADSADGIVKRPCLIADFRKQRYAQTVVASDSISGASATSLGVMQECSFSDIFTFTRASTATYIDAAGAMQTAAINTPRFDYTNGYSQLLHENTNTNIFLNSAVGATQSVTVSATAYVLSFWGTGSITLSGTSTGTISGTGATTRKQSTFTPTAGTLTLTVSGSVTNVQLETGTVATSYSPSAGVAGARSDDQVRFGAKALALIQRTACGVSVKGQGLFGASGRFIGGNSSHRIIGFNGATTKILAGQTTFIQSTTTVTTPLPAFGTAAGWDGSGKALSYNGDTIATDSTAMDADRTLAFLGRDNGAQRTNGWYDELVIYPFRPSNAALVAKALAYG